MSSTSVDITPSNASGNVSWTVQQGHRVQAYLYQVPHGVSTWYIVDLFHNHSPVVF